MSDDYDYSECDKLFEREFGKKADANDPLHSGSRTYWEARRDGFRACYRKLRPENVDYAYKELEELEQRLRHDFIRHPFALVTEKAADAIRQQAETIESLKRCLKGTMADLVKERNTLQSKLSAAQQRLEMWEGQEVVVVHIPAHFSMGVKSDRRQWKIGEKLVVRLPDTEGEKV